VKVYIDPTVILVSTKVDDSVIDKIDPEARTVTSESGDSESGNQTIPVFYTHT